MASNNESAIVGITGASGQLGRRVLELATERIDPRRIVAITRSPEKLAEFSAKGVDVRVGDFADTDSLPTVFSGIDRLYIISVDDITPGERARLHGNAIAAAKAAGVQHIIYSSAPKPHHAPMTFLRDHAATEDILVASGVAYTILRNNFYLELVLQSATSAIASGTLYSATQNGAVGYVSRDDCARAAAAVLTSSGHEGAVYDITGSYAWTQDEIAAEVGRAIGRTINYVSLTPDALQQALIANGLPEGMAGFLVAMDTGIQLGALDVVSRAVEQLTGSAPESLPDFLARHRGTLAG